MEYRRDRDNTRPEGTTGRPPGENPSSPPRTHQQYAPSWAPPRVPAPSWRTPPPAFQRPGGSGHGQRPVHTRNWEGEGDTRVRMSTRNDYDRNRGRYDDERYAPGAVRLIAKAGNQPFQILGLKNRTDYQPNSVVIKGKDGNWYRAVPYGSNSMGGRQLDRLKGRLDYYDRDGGSRWGGHGGGHWGGGWGGRSHWGPPSWAPAWGFRNHGGWRDGGHSRGGGWGSNYSHGGSRRGGHGGGSRFSNVHYLGMSSPGAPRNVWYNGRTMYYSGEGGGTYLVTPGSYGYISPFRHGGHGRRGRGHGGRDRGHDRERRGGHDRDRRDNDRGSSSRRSDGWKRYQSGERDFDRSRERDSRHGSWFKDWWRRWH